MNNMLTGLNYLCYAFVCGMAGLIGKRLHAYAELKLGKDDGEYDFIVDDDGYCYENEATAYDESVIAILSYLEPVLVTIAFILICYAVYYLTKGA